MDPLPALPKLAPADLVLTHLSLSDRIAGHLWRRHPHPPWVDLEDLQAAGRLGLVLASLTYDPTRGASFRTWAGHQVRRQVLDLLRRSDPLRRGDRARVTAGQRDEWDRVARGLGIYRDDLGDVRHTTLTEAADAVSDPRPDPLEELCAREQVAALYAALRRLPARWGQAVQTWMAGRPPRVAAVGIGLMAGTVQEYRRRARARLREDLKEYR